MNEDNVDIDGLDRASLTNPVRRVLGRPGAEIFEWQTRPIAYRHVNPVSGGLYRVTGTAQDGGETIPWSLVLKITQPIPPHVARAAAERLSLSPAEIVMVQDAYGWNREANAYRSGVLDTLVDGLRAPHCYGVDDHSGPSIWLWLEDVDADPAPWSMARYGLSARHLGAWNGVYLTGRRLPDAPWLCQGGLRTWATIMVRPVVRAIRQTEFWEQPLVRRAFPVPVAERLLALWQDHPALLDTLDRLPHTFCHLDAFRPNLLSVGKPKDDNATVALDWAFVGTGAIGEEIGQLVAASLLHAGADVSRAAELGETVLDGYLEGLRDASWRGYATPAGGAMPGWSGSVTAPQQRCAGACARPVCPPVRRRRPIPRRTVPRMPPPRSSDARQ
jgi:hypothetical protein